MSLHASCLRRICWTYPHTRWKHIQGRKYGSSTATESKEDWFPKLRSEMLSRPVVSSREYVNTDTDHKLADSLSTFMPPRWSKRLDRGRSTVPLGHNLVWFNTSMPVDQLLPDGTDPLQSPGEPWVRRMWAGGSMTPKKEAYYNLEKGFAIDTDMVYAERIQDVQLRGSGDAAKIFVTIERRYARLDTLQEKLSLRPSGDRRLTPNALLREQMLQEEEWGDAVLKEQRNLVFLKEKTSAELEAISAGQFVPVRYLNSPGEPDFSHSLTPTRSLLFRYSALTLNAHLIHLDRDYARNVEGHRNLLVHGPLSLTMMLQIMWGYIKREAGSKYTLHSIRYRNLAPLYCDEEMRICVKKKETLDDGALYDIWVEGPTGGVAVKGAVRTVERVHTSDANKAPAASKPGPTNFRKSMGENDKPFSKATSEKSDAGKTELHVKNDTRENGTTEQVDPQLFDSKPGKRRAYHRKQSATHTSTFFREGVRKIAKPRVRQMAPLERPEDEQPRRYGL